MNKPKILFFDIENLHRPEHIFNSGKQSRFGPRPAGFCSDLAYILVFGYKWLGDEKARYITVSKKEFKEDPHDDSPMLGEIFRIMSEADVIVSYYGSGHDFPFVTSRLAQQGLYLDQKIMHIDLYKIANKHLRLSSNRLNNVSKFFGQEPKTDISKKVWADCWKGDYKALMEMSDYCAQDVEVLEQVFHKLKPLIPHRFHFGRLEGKSEASCKSCGSEKLHGNGYRVTRMKRYRRLRCGECGSHQKGEVVDG